MNIKNRDIRWIRYQLFVIVILFSCSDGAYNSQTSTMNASEVINTGLELDSIVNSKVGVDVDSVSEPISKKRDVLIDTLPMFNWGDYEKFKFEKTNEKTIIEFPTYSIEIEGKFKIKEYENNDTIDVYEGFANYIFGRLISIKSKNEIDTFHLHITVKERIAEHLSDSLEHVLKTDEKITTWSQSSVKWNGYKTEIIDDSLGNYYRLPAFGALNGYFEQKREKEFNLRDTLVINYGTGQNVGSLVYKGKVCNYYITERIITIFKFSNGESKALNYLRLILDQ